MDRREHRSVVGYESHIIHAWRNFPSFAICIVEFAESSAIHGAFGIIFRYGLYRMVVYSGYLRFIFWIRKLKYIPFYVVSSTFILVPSSIFGSFSKTCVDVLCTGCNSIVALFWSTYLTTSPSGVLVKILSRLACLLLKLYNPLTSVYW